MSKDDVGPLRTDPVLNQARSWPRITHELKTWPEFFQATLNAVKRFELRRDDRPEGFQVGDYLLLREWDPDAKGECSCNDDPVKCPHHGDAVDWREGAPPIGYTGREVLVRVDYVMPMETVGKIMGLEIPYPAEHVIMSVSWVH